MDVNTFLRCLATFYVASARAGAGKNTSLPRRGPMHSKARRAAACLVRRGPRAGWAAARRAACRVKLRYRERMQARRC